MKKILVFLKGFSDVDRAKLATLTGLLLSHGMCTASVLQSLLQDHLVKDGIAISFACETFKVWLSEKDIGSVVATLKKASLESRLLDLLPINKRTTDNLHRHFEDAGLKTLITYQKSQQNAGAKKELQKQVKEMVQNEEPVKEIVQTIKEMMKKDALPEHEVMVLMWNVLMSTVEWSNKEDLLAEQAIKHIKQYTPVFSALTASQRSELALMIRIQEYCYENMNFMKLFQKIIVIFYKVDVLSEDAVLKWYKESHSTKGKTVFLEQMKKFVEWLMAAEEESEGEEDD